MTRTRLYYAYINVSFKFNVFCMYILMTQIKYNLKLFIVLFHCFVNITDKII